MSTDALVPWDDKCTPDSGAQSAALPRREILNEDLLREALAVPAIRVFFQHKVQAVDFDRKTLAVRDVEGAKDVTVSFDFCVGADGSYSIIRRQLMRVVQCVYPIDPLLFSLLP